MNPTTEKDRPRNKLIRISFNVAYVVLIVSAIQFFSDYMNDNYGWVALLAVITLSRFHEMLLSLWAGNKKSAVFDLLFALLTLAYLIYIIV